MWVFFGCESVSASLLWSRYIGFGKKEKKKSFSFVPLWFDDV